MLNRFLAALGQLLFVLSRRTSLVTLLGSTACWAMATADEGVLKDLAEAKSELTESRYELAYKFQSGDVVSYDIEHLVAVDTTISGNNQKTKLRSRSTRSLAVKDVSAEGQICLVHTIDYVDMWSEVGGREAVHYQSDQQEPPPPEYERVAENVGKPISEITIDASGRIVDRQDKVQHPDLGLGGITIPLPKGPVPIGHSWSQPLEIRVRSDDQRIKVIKTRELYRLAKVETGIAVITVATQILTPLDDPRIKSQLIQRISTGEIRFDVDAGRLVSRKLEWDESVLGFNGPDSNMKYLAQFTETLNDAPRTAQRHP